MSRRSVLSAVMVAAALASTFLFASPAAADPVSCGPGYDPAAKCAFVTGVTDVLNVRSGPGTSYSIVRTLANGAKVELYCWTTGTYVNGYNIWTRFDTIDNHPEYVSDYYLTTGVVQNFLPQCP